MNDTFNIKRFGSYFRAECASCVSNYGLGILLMSLMGVIIYVGTVLMGLIFKGEWGGPGIEFRTTAFVICMVVLLLTLPVRCYGMITEKNAGRDWLLVPVSKLEKVLGMVLITVLVVPVSVCTLYLGLDALMCALDGTCGLNIVRNVKAAVDVPPMVHIQPSVADGTSLVHFLRQVKCPWLYVDDVIGVSLMFLLGSILFRKGKIVKTIFVIWAVSVALGVLIVPLAQALFGDVHALQGEMTAAEAMQVFDMSIFRNIALYDTLNDTIVNILLLAGIYFRISTLKH